MNNIELRYLVVYKRKTREPDLEDYAKFAEIVSEKSYKTLNEFYGIFEKALGKENMGKINSFQTQEYKLYEDEYVDSLIRMFNSIKEDIADFKSRGTQIIYLIDTSNFKGIDFQENIPFVNYVAY